MGEQLELREIDQPESRWGAATALFAGGALYLILAPKLTVGPAWLPAALVFILEIPAWIALANDREEAANTLGHVISAVLTVFLGMSVYLLVNAVLGGNERAPDLLRSAVALYFVNIIVFAAWYWRLDAGGPMERGKLPTHKHGAFYFPQMSMSDEVRNATCEKDWKPGFVDYLFLAFNTSTALSPADTGALTRWAKGLMMIQSVISLTIIVLLAGRAVNIIQNKANIDLDSPPAVTRSVQAPASPVSQ